MHFGESLLARLTGRSCLSGPPHVRQSCGVAERDTGCSRRDGCPVDLSFVRRPSTAASVDRCDSRAERHWRLAFRERIRRSTVRVEEQPVIDPPGGGEGGSTAIRARFARFDGVSVSESTVTSETLRAHRRSTRAHDRGKEERGRSGQERMTPIVKGSVDLEPTGMELRR